MNIKVRGRISWKNPQLNFYQKFFSSIMPHWKNIYNANLIGTRDFKIDIEGILHALRLE
jgi:hypothetical protein